MSLVEWRKLYRSEESLSASTISSCGTLTRLVALGGDMSFELSSIKGGIRASGIGIAIIATEGVLTVVATIGLGALCRMNLWSLVIFDTLNFSFISFSMSSLCWAIISTVIG